MSINFSTPHRVDVPVTDLDDDDDDILFDQQPKLNDLEYNPPKPSFLQRFKRLVSNNYQPIENYELTEYDDFIIQDEPISRPNNKRYIYILFFVFMAFLALLVFIFTGKSPPVLHKMLISNSTHNFYPTTIVVSLDGFHPHYISAELTPALHEIMTSDYGAPYMIPSFPSSTFPNHWTLVTGLYPSEHGIVGNTFYDPKLRKQFVNTNPKVGGLDPDFWHGGEPIWRTAANQGVRSAVHMWPGSEVPGVGIDNGPLFVDRYNGLELLSSKVSRVMGWLDIEDIETRPELILTYVPTIDLYGHKYGISGANLSTALSYVDDFVNLMKKEISVRNLTDIVNLIFVSDHGMAPTSNDRLLYVDDLVNMLKIDHVDGWPLYGLRPAKGVSVDEIYDEMTSKLSEVDAENFDIYKVQDLPKEWNFGGSLNDHKFNYRLAPIWVIPHVGYAVTTHAQMKEKNNDYTPKGVHGYNNTELLMRATFLGSGPYFKAKLSDSKKVQPFSNVEVYNIICDSLNLIPSPNNGTISNGYIDSPVSGKYILSEEWTDNLTYPNLGFQVNHLVEEATYDLLWKPKGSLPEQSATPVKNPNPEDPLKSAESALDPNPSLSRPSGFTSIAVSRPAPSDAGDSLKLFDHVGEEIDEFLDDISEGVEDTLEDVGDIAEELGKGAKEAWDKLNNIVHGDN